MDEKRTAKVRFQITLDVDLEAWEQDYGVQGARNIQEDVRKYLRNLILCGGGAGLEYLEEHRG